MDDKIPNKNTESFSEIGAKEKRRENYIAPRIITMSVPTVVTGGGQLLPESNEGLLAS